MDNAAGTCLTLLRRIRNHWVGFSYGAHHRCALYLGQFTNSAMSADSETALQLVPTAGITHVVTFSIEACYGAIDRGKPVHGG